MNGTVTGWPTAAVILVLAAVLIIAPVAADTMTREEGINRDGNDFSSLFVGNPGYNGTAESCSEACLSQPACNAATWVARDQSCWLKEIVPGPSTHVGTISFLKVKTQAFDTSGAKQSSGSNGGIAVGSTPLGASVYVDGVFKGLTPLTITDIPAGSHSLLVTLKGYDNYQQTVTVTAGTVAPVSVEFGGKKTPGFESFLVILGCFGVMLIRRQW